MIDEKELMIGNNVMRDGIVVTVDAKTIYDLSYYASVFENEYEPIPITDEWLEKLGFKKMKMPFTGQEGFGIATKDVFVGFTHQENDFFDFHNPHFNVKYKYVHEIQNILTMLKISL